MVITVAMAASRAASVFLFNGLATRITGLLASSIRRADMPKYWEEQVAKNQSFPTTLLLTKDDLALIKKVTGAEIDYDTGNTTDELSPAASDFVQVLTDTRYDDFVQASAPDELTASDIREVFKDRAMANKPLDPNFLTEALKWFDYLSKSSNQSIEPPPQKSVGAILDQYA